MEVYLAEICASVLPQNMEDGVTNYVLTVSSYFGECCFEGIQMQSLVMLNQREKLNVSLLYYPPNCRPMSLNLIVGVVLNLLKLLVLGVFKLLSFLESGVIRGNAKDP